MSDKKVPELTELTTPSNDDLLVIVDTVADTTKKIKLSDLVAGAGFSTGDIKYTCRQTADSGFLLCDGDEVSRTTYADLFAIIGETYGEGDGVDTFNVPDLRGKVIVAETGASDEFDEAGMTGGDTKHQLTVAELPAHTHTYIKASAGSPTQIFYQTGMEMAQIEGIMDTQDSTASTGDDGEHNNCQPYLVVSLAQIKY